MNFFSGLESMLSYVPEGDCIHVYAVDRLGRDAIDVQTTIRALAAQSQGCQCATQHRKWPLI